MFNSRPGADRPSGGRCEQTLSDDIAIGELGRIRMIEVAWSAILRLVVFHDQVSELMPSTLQCR